MKDSFLFKSPAAADRFGHYLRHAQDAGLRCRRGVIALSLVSAGVMGVTALYQSGLIRRMPGPHTKPFDADRVNGSAQAYQALSTPDAFLGLASYAATAALAAAGGDDRPPWLPVALAAKATLDAAAAAKLGVDQATTFKAYSAVSLLATLCTFVALPLTLPDAVRAVRNGRRT